MAEGRPARTFVTNRRKSAANWSRPVLVLGATLLTCGLVPATGCKTGTSFSKPTWPTFGSLPKKKDSADDLAAAPPYSGELKKPSETAQRYPTTSTPNGYVLTGTGGVGGEPGQAAQTPAAVVYGTTPTPPAAQTPTAVTAAPTPAGAGPQVGPYASMSPADSIPPPGQPLPPIAPTTTAPVATMPMTTAPLQNPSQPSIPGVAGTNTPAESALPGSAYSSFPPAGVAASGPAARMADARLPEPVSSAAQPPSALGAAAIATPAAVGSRYAGSSPSRFASESGAAMPAATAFDQSLAPAPVAPASTLPAGQPAAVPEPAVAPAAAPVPSAPGAPAPGLLQPGAAPVRRPDPAWRPGGTSSYRPSRTILADDQPPAGPAVRTAAFEDVESGVSRQ